MNLAEHLGKSSLLIQVLAYIKCYEWQKRQPAHQSTHAILERQRE